MRLITLVLIIITVDVATAQTYVQHWFNFRDSVNSKNIYGAGLGEVLLYGYLNGDLTAYAFDYKSEDVKFKPIPKELIPAAWDPKLAYFVGDMITYEGGYYECMMDAPAGMRPGANDYWFTTALQPEPLSTVYSFPGTADITTKKEFLGKFIAYEDQYLGDPWMKDYEYYTMDVVQFQGLHYSCLADNNGKQPDLEKDYWVIRNPQLQFHSPRDLYTVGTLYAIPSAGATAVPQMLSAYALDDNTGIWKSVGLNFKFHDAMSYLAHLNERPLVCRTRLGYTGAPQIFFGYENSHTVLQFLQMKLMDGRLKPGKKDILNPDLYKTFAETVTEELSAVWTFTQDMVSNDVLIGAIRYEALGPVYTPVLRLPWKVLEPLFKAEVPSPAPLDFIGGLQPNQFNVFIDTVAIDTLEAMPYTPVTAPPTSERYFIDQRSASTTSNPSLAKAMQSLWDVVLPVVQSGDIGLRPYEEKPFTCNQTFPEMTIERDRRWIIGDGFRLEEIQELKLDTLYSMLPVAGLVAEYERTLTREGDKGKPLFRPKRLAVRVYSPEVSVFVDYFFNWDDVKKVIDTKPELQKLVEAIEKGKLVFDTQVAVGGLMGRY
jgi:hypothetical protein